MRKQRISLYFTLFSINLIWAQNVELTGRVLNIWSHEPIPKVKVSIEGTLFETLTNTAGLFSFKNLKLPLGEQRVLVAFEDYVSQRIPIVLVAGKTVHLDPILLQVDLSRVNERIGLVSISDSELNQDDGTVYNISGLLQASRDVFLRAAAFDFSSTFFKPRGLDNSFGKVLINGLEMNKQFNGRPQWSNWGGLNDVQRNREFSMGLDANDYAFGDVAGTTNIIMRASRYRQGGQVSIASANRSYRARIMATYHSGLTRKRWAYSVSAARRSGTEGFVDGTPYNANSFFLSVEKKLGKAQSFNITAFYTPNERGRSSAITQEVYDLKGLRYNPNWGYQENRIRNSRIREINEPVVLLNHYWDISEKIQLNTNLGYQFGTISNSRIDANGTQLIETLDGQSFFIGGARNPLGNYYQRLPSYFLRTSSPTAYQFQLAYQAQQEFVQNGQLDWAALYRANTDFQGIGRPATYVLQNDVTEDAQISMNTIMTTEINEHFSLNGTLSYRHLTSQNYAEVSDLLGSSGYLDIDSFTEAASGDESEGSTTDRAQSDLRNPNRIAQQGERYKYNYEIEAKVSNAFVQAQFAFTSMDFHLGVRAGQTSYQRNGLFENGNFPKERSLGLGELLSFTTYGIKGGILYKLTGRHLIDINAGYFTKPPSIRESFTNARQNNDVVNGVEVTTVQNLSLSYRYRSPVIRARFTGFYVGFENQNDLGFYFTEDISGLGINGDAFVQEVMTGINTRNLGVEIGIETQLTPTFKVKLAGSLGQYIYTNNPSLYLSSDDFEGPIVFGDGTARLKNYHVAGGPERAYQIGIEYRDPGFWWLGITGNYFSHAFIDVNNLARTTNYTSDFDGQPFNDYDEVEGKRLLQQEQIEPYALIHAVGGKSWRIGRYFVGFFASINNLLNQQYRTGGFEQGRNTNYRTIKEDRSRAYGPLFGNRYFYGSGTTYYVNAYVRF
ncbi:MAG: carboxypeptidase regulatory-like domain-containing protein [Bacteroidota bacterium]